MVKIFKNVSPARMNEDIDKESLQLALTTEDIFAPKQYCWLFEFDCQVLQQAIYLNGFFDQRGVKIPIGLVCSPNSSYPGWNLLLDTTYVKGSLALEVSMFFNFTGVENDNILYFEDLICESWDGNF